LVVTFAFGWSTRPWDSAPVVMAAHGLSGSHGPADDDTLVVWSVGNQNLLLSIEEQLDLVLNDYLDFENAILSISTRWMVFLISDFGDFDKDRNLIAIVDFLTCLMRVAHISITSQITLKALEYLAHKI
jgi:hypothetical protein